MNAALRNGNQDLDNLIEEAIGLDTHKHDYMAPVTDFSFDDHSYLNVPATEFGQPAPLAVEEHAYRQLFRRLGLSVEWPGGSKKKGLPTDYFLAIPDDLRADLLNRHIADFPGTGSAGGMTVRAFDENCRAIMSGRYAIYDNLEALELFRDLVVNEAEDSDFSIIKSSTVTRDSLFVRSIWKETGIGDDGQPDQTGSGGFGVGVFFGNNETGRGKLKVGGLIQRHECTNSIISNDMLELRHIGDPELLRAELQVNVARMFEKSAGMLKQMVRATMKRVPSFTDVLAGLADEYDWSQKVTLSVAAGTENQDTVAGLVNGVTWAAHEATESADDQLALETLGGVLLERGTDDKYADGDNSLAFSLFANKGVRARQEERVIL